MYYHLQGNSAILTTYTEAVNETQDSLILGRALEEEYEELPYIYTYHDPAGNPLPDYFGGDCIMSKKMLKVLQDSGAYNIQVLPLEFIDKDTEEVRSDYVVFNILGLISCAKVDESDKIPLGGGFYFRNLVIDPDLLDGRPIFRLKESYLDIIIREDLAQALNESNIQGIILTPLKSAKS